MMENPGGPGMTGAALFNIRDFGALGDGAHKDTPAIQKAIDACTAFGGGVVYCPPGTYLSGTVFLKDNVELHLEAGATLLGSPERADYSAWFPTEVWVGLENLDHHLVCARRAHNVAITGRGTIDGNGRAFFGPKPTGHRRHFFSIPGWRPGAMVTFMNCQDVSLRDVHLTDAPHWTVWPHVCDGVKIQGVSIVSNRGGLNCDGINAHCCRDMRISDCYITSGDDCIAIYSDGFFGSDLQPSENIVVTNCVLSTACNGIRVGYIGDLPIRNCSFSNLVMFNTRTGISMICQPSVGDSFVPDSKHGPISENISFDNILMEARKPIDLWIDGAATRPAAIRNVSISNINATVERGCHVGGAPSLPIENLRIKDVLLRVRGEMPADAAWEVPYPYPRYDWDTPGLPYGLYCRHVHGLELHNVRVEWENAVGRWASAIRVENAEDLELAGVCAVQAPGGAGAPAIHLTNVNGAFVRGCRAAPGTGTFMAVDGPASAHVVAVGNDLSRAEEAFHLSEQAPAQVFQQAANVLP